MTASLQDRLQSLLRAAERLTRTDLSYLFRGGIWLVLGQISISGLAFLASIAFAHFVSKDDYGTYRFLLSVFWSLTAFGLSGIPPALVRAVARGASHAYTKALSLSLIGSIPVAIGSLGLALYYFSNGNLELTYGCLIIAAVGPLMQSAYLYGAYLEGKRAFRENALSGIVLNAIPTLVLLGLMTVTNSPLAFLAAYLGASVLTGAAISIFVYRTLVRNTSSIEDEKITSLGVHLSAINMLFTLAQQADKLLVFHALGAVNLAIYTFAVAMPDQLKAILGNLETLAFPKFAQRHINEVLPTLGRRLFGFTGLVTVLVIFYIVMAPYLFGFLFPTYMDSVFISQVYALSLIPVGSVVPLSLLQANAAKRELYILNISMPILQIAALAFGVTYFGLIGAIVARVFARFATFITTLLLAHAYGRRNKLSTLTN